MALDDATVLVESIIDLRRSRAGQFPPDLFIGEQGWDILLELFVADAHGERLTARELLQRIGGSRIAGERWIRFTNSQGLTVSDGEGRLDDIVTATPEALQRVEVWAAGCIDFILRLVEPRMEHLRRHR
ncbi:hypothetical protein GGQ80_001545 [Sphingomonas jinjuensis]|uniref:Uncharacterized protein n=1 Tax=Sphingomonas jinjuensis TaxID=535907 RepID=A0A840F7E3_9SPHN|nr:hypothetical protein [Sphingomonas jinjuensis]MBB4153639.1 hypothetical protein [Sphingomonas jinjuensis]